MLINKNTGSLEAGEVIVMKLSSGEEIIAKIESTDNGVVKLHRPCALGMGPGGAVLNKWAVLADKDKLVDLKMEFVMATAAPDKEIADHYESITSSIVKAPAGLVTGQRMVKSKRKPSLRFRLTEDYVVNLNRKNWFIDVEQYLWTRFASKQFKNATFRDWLEYLLEPMRPYLSIRIVNCKSTDERSLSHALAVGGAYDNFVDKKKKKPIKLTVYHWKWPDYSAPHIKEWFAHEIFKTIVHELNHLKQGRKKNYSFDHWVGPYLEDPDEIDSYALNAAQGLVARFGVREAKKRVANFKTRDSHCSELCSYAKIDNLVVQSRFLKRLLKYINVYEEYEYMHGKHKLNSYKLHRKHARTRQAIKKQISIQKSI